MDLLLVCRSAFQLVEQLNGRVPTIVVIRNELSRVTWVRFPYLLFSQQRKLWKQLHREGNLRKVESIQLFLLHRQSVVLQMFHLLGDKSIVLELECSAQLTLFLTETIRLHIASGTRVGSQQILSIHNHTHPNRLHSIVTDPFRMFFEQLSFDDA